MTTHPTPSIDRMFILHFCIGIAAITSACAAGFVPAASTSTRVVGTIAAASSFAGHVPLLSLRSDDGDADIILHGSPNEDYDDSGGVRDGCDRKEDSLRSWHRSSAEDCPVTTLRDLRRRRLLILSTTMAVPLYCFGGKPTPSTLSAAFAADDSSAQHAVSEEPRECQNGGIVSGMYASA